MRHKDHSHFICTTLRPQESLAQKFFLLYAEKHLVWLSFTSPEISSVSYIEATDVEVQLKGAITRSTRHAGANPDTL